MDSRVEKIRKFNISIAIVVMVILSLLMNYNVIFAQESQEVGLSAGIFSENPLNFKLYETGQNTIKFEVPRESHMTISLFDEYGNLVKVLLYDNIQPGIYEYNLTNQLPVGKYTCRLSSGDISESKDLVLK